MKLLLRREPKQPSHECTLGLLFLGDLSLVSIERPWIASATSKGGSKGISCVPVGTYKLVRHNSDAHPMTWALVNEELDVVHYPRAGLASGTRTAVLIHPANWAAELRGCIAPGTRAGLGERGYQVYDSRKAMKMIQDRMPWTDENTLTIEEAT
jgi:hypothetical protein